MFKQILAAAAAALWLGGCASVPAAERSSAAALSDAGGRTVARTVVRQVSEGLAVHVESAGLAPGVYGVHLHAVGRCEAPGFTTAGPHWNPTARQHGRDNPAGAHLGDLPNLNVGADGRGAVDYTVAGGALFGAGANTLLDSDGAAVVVHAQADDYRTDPSGNSGARIACGVLGRG